MHSSIPCPRSGRAKVLRFSAGRPDATRVVCFLATTIAWTIVYLYIFNSSTTTSSPLMSAAQEGRPRIVFSFTPTPPGINEMQKTLDALVHQEGDGFDVAKMYRDELVEIPAWLLDNTTTLLPEEFHGLTFATGASPFHDKIRLIILDTDFGPASKVLATLMVEQDPEMIIVYGDDDRLLPPQLSERVLYYSHKYPNDAFGVLGGWISAEDGLYCGRSLAVGFNSVSFVGGAGGVAVKRKFYGMGEATMPAFQVANMSKACFFGDDYYLSHLLSRNGVRRRLVSDSCWNLDSLTATYAHWGISGLPSKHPGGVNVENYQQCIRELGKDQDLPSDGEFAFVFMFIFSRMWRGGGVLRGLWNLCSGGKFVAC